jgi:hypothetical protein
LFETLDRAEIDIPDALKDPGNRAWAYVFRRIHMPWFHVVFGVPSDMGGLQAQILFLTGVDQLVQLTEQRHGRILEVQMVLPRHASRAGRWTMVPLIEAWMATEPEVPQSAYVYVLANGRRYVESGLDTDESELVDRRRIFRSQLSHKKGRVRA